MKIGQTYLITTDQWFHAPNGEQYRAVFGTVHELVDSEKALGVKTNSKSTNWYVVIGDMVVAGCQVHYAVRCDGFSSIPPEMDIEHEGKLLSSRVAVTRIYNANESGLIPER